MSNNEQMPSPEREQKELEALVKTNMNIWLESVASVSDNQQKTSADKEALEKIIKEAAKKVSELHQKDGVFDPTMLGEIKIGPEGACEYHEHFLKNIPIGELIDDDNAVVDKIGDDAYIYQGKYKFTFGGDPDNFAEADFSYIWKKDENGKYKIAYHHSSVFPKDKKQQQILDSLKENFQGEIQEEKFLQIDDDTMLHIGKVKVGEDLIRFSQLEKNGEVSNKHYSFNPE